MIAFDGDLVAQEVARRSSEQKWQPEQTLVVSRICAWHVDHPDARIGYEDGQPGSDMRDMIEGVSRDTGIDSRRILMSYGASHCLLCDVVPGFRPVLFSAWDRSVERSDHGQ